MSTAAVTGREVTAVHDLVQRVQMRLVRPMPADGWLGWAVPLAIALFAGVMRFWRITRPPDLIFDETYYAKDSWSLLQHGVEIDQNNHGPGFVVHPPLGKWMIAGGEAIWGDNPLGWRFASAVVGTLAVLMLARIGRRLFRSTWIGAIAGLLLALDGLEFVQSRVSMLDIFLMFWVLAAFGCLVLDRDQGRRRMAALLESPRWGDLGPWLGFRPWRWACGVCLGAACATKWSGIFWVPVFFALALVWDAAARRTAGVTSPMLSAIAMDGVYALVPFVLVAVAVYTASWTGWFLSDGAHAYDHDRFVHAGQSWFGHGRAVLHGWWQYHREVWHFHRGLDAQHPYLSRPWGWLLLSRPVAYFYATPGGCGASDCAQEVLGVGTPALWWASIGALVFTAWRGVTRLDWRATAVFAAFAAGYLPWFMEDGEHRTMFLFYLLPAVPFMCLAVAYAVGVAIGDRSVDDVRRIVAVVLSGVYLLGVLANFAWLYPVLSGSVITNEQWRHRMDPITWTCNQDDDRNQHKELAGCWI